MSKKNVHIVGVEDILKLLNVSRILKKEDVNTFYDFVKLVTLNKKYSLEMHDILKIEEDIAQAYYFLNYTDYKKMNEMNEVGDYASSTAYFKTKRATYIVQNFANVKTEILNTIAATFIDAFCIVDDDDNHETDEIYEYVNSYFEKYFTLDCIASEHDYNRNDFKHFPNLLDKYTIHFNYLQNDKMANILKMIVSDDRLKEYATVGYNLFKIYIELFYNYLLLELYFDKFYELFFNYGTTKKNKNKNDSKYISLFYYCLKFLRAFAIIEDAQNTYKKVLDISAFDV